jgi:drug/metabolite transporter (DMT)-like permease
MNNIIAGIVLGVPNYFSIYFVLDSLEKLGGIIVFPILNIGVVLLSSILSYLFYKEYLSKLNWIGIGLACISILLILVF